MRFLLKLGRTAIVAAVFVSMPSLALGQVDGRFSGVVVDQSGGLVPGATVVVKNERTGEERTAVTGSDGRFVITGLKPSLYLIRGELSGFAPLEYTGLQLTAGQEFSLDLKLAAAGLTEQITVQAESTAIDLSSARVGVNVSEREILSLPVNGRQMSQLMLQSPGSQNAGTGTWNDVRFSGRANQQNVIKFDGVEGSAIIDAAPGNIAGQIASPFKLQASLENVQEFRVEANNYPAEYGTGTGGQVSVVTKSGSNDFRGSVFEYYRDDSFDSPNYFDAQRNTDGSVISEGTKSKLNQHQFGGSFGGPLVRNRAFFFASYEGYQLDAGVNFQEAVPSQDAWARAVPAIAALQPGYTAPGAVLLPGASSDPNFDIYQLQGLEEVEENAFSLRLDYKVSQQWSSYFRIFHDRGTQVRPGGVSPNLARLTNNPTNAVFNLQGIFGQGLLNELKVGYNAPYAHIEGEAPVVNGIDFSNFAINMTGSVASSGIAGQTGASGVAVVGGLVRASSATNGRAIFYDPYSLSVSDAISAVRGSHLVKVGGEARMIRMTTDQLGGTTYTFANLNAFLANTPQSTQYVGDISAPSAFNNGATGMRHTKQSYFVGFAQDEWRAAPNLTLNLGLRYEYYTPLEVKDNLIVKFNLESGTIDPNTTPLHGTRKNNIQPRIAMTYAADKTVFRTGFGVFVGPGQGEDLIQPIESDRVISSITSGALNVFPTNTETIVSNFTTNPNTRAYQPRAYAQEYAIPEKIYQYTASVQQDLGHGLTTTAAYVGSRGHNLFLRSVANQIVEVWTHPNPGSNALLVREFSIVTRDTNGNVTAVQQPYAEIDFKTTGGHDEYNALMLSVNRRSINGLAMNLQYTLGRSRGTSGGSNEANTAANNARTLEEFEYDFGSNNFDVRHTFNVSMLYQLPYGSGRRFGSDAGPVAQAVLGGWEVGGIFNARSGLPIPVQIVRPDVLYRDESGSYFANPLAGRTAVLNTPGGGASRNVRRPNLVPGVDPYLKEGGLLFLNPAAFSVPMPGEFGDLERNSIVGPGFKQVDFFFSKRFSMGGGSAFEFRGEVFNLFNTVNYANPVGTLPTAIPTTALTEANRLQPGQAYTPGAAGTFGRMTATVGRTVGLGTARQMQFAVRVLF